MRTVRRLLSAAVILVLAVVAAGCLSVHGDVTLDRRARATGQLSIELAKSAAGLMGVTGAADLRSMIGTDTYGVVTTSETADNYVMTMDLDRANMNQPGGMYAAVVPDRKVMFTLAFPDQGSGTGDEDSLLPSDVTLGTVDLTLHFPGKITYLQGPGIAKVDDRTARINTQLTTTILQASSPATGGWEVDSRIDPPPSLASRLLVIVPAAAGFALVVAVAVVIARRRPPRPPAETPTGRPVGPAGSG